MGQFFLPEGEGFSLANSEKPNFRTSAAKFRVRCPVEKSLEAWMKMVHGSRDDGADSTDSGHGLVSSEGDRSNIR
jgi:hypothetical protein